MKKAIFLYGGIMLAASVVLSAAYYMSYKKTMEHYTQKVPEENTVSLVEEEQQELAQVDTIKQSVVDAGTRYVVETDDRKTGAVRQEVKPIPAALLGLDRTETADYLSDYMVDLPIEDYLSGLVAFDLVSFSEKQVVVRKTFDAESVKYQFYMTVKKNEIIVYYSDKKTLYEYTGINTLNLSAEDRIQLAKGMYIVDQEELYGILENYSS